MDRTYKTSAADEAHFEARVRYWLKVLSLGDWKVEVFRADTGEDSAHAEMWHDAHGAFIKLSELLKYKPTKRWLNALALHEVAHILLCDLKRLIKDRVVTDNMADTAEHAIIRRLENALADGTADVSDMILTRTSVRAAPSLRRLAKR